MLGLQAEQIVLELGQLAGAVQAVGVDDVGYIGFRVAVLAGVQIQHELDQGPVQAGDAGIHDREAGTGDLRRRFEVELAEGFAHVHVVAGFEIELAGRAPAAQLHVVVLVAAVGRLRVGQVGQAAEQFVQFLLHQRQFLFGHLELFAQGRDLGQDGAGILPFGLGLADGLRAGLAFVLQVLHPHLQGLALFVQGAEAVHVEVEAPPGQLRADEFGIAAQQFGIEHVVVPGIRR